MSLTQTLMPTDPVKKQGGEWPRKADESHVERWPDQWMLRNAVGEISHLRGNEPVGELDGRYDQARYVPAQKLEEVERERDKLRREAKGTHELLAHFRDERQKLQATLTALVGDEAVEAIVATKLPGGTTAHAVLVQRIRGEVEDDLRVALAAAKQQAETNQKAASAASEGAHK